MKRRPVRILLALLVLAGLALVLRQDLADLAVREGNAKLRSSDISGAEAAFDRAVALGRDAAPLAYDLGVGLYRKGDYPRARARFAASLATAGPELASAIYYNLGNCQFRQGERLAARDREAARAFLREAGAGYGKALALAPGAADAAGNLDLVRARLAALGGETARDGSRREPGAEHAGKSGAGNGPEAGTMRAQPSSSQVAEGGAREAGRADASATAGKTHRALTRQEAERLLSEARGREKPAGMPFGGKPDGQLAKPDRDW